MFTLTKAQNGWYLMVPQESSDNEEYQFQILNCVLFVKVVTLNDHLYKSLHSRMEKEKILFHYRKLALKTEILNAHSILFESNNLFPDSESPVRIYFMLVRNKSLGRSYKNNPFSFIRSLKVPKLANAKQTDINSYSGEAYQALQLEILRKQQEENSQILAELLKLKKKEKRRKEKRKLAAKQKKILQTDGNDSDAIANEVEVKVDKGKRLQRGRNLPKQSRKLDQNQPEIGVEETGPDSKLETLLEERKASKSAREKITSQVTSSDSDESELSYEPTSDENSETDSSGTFEDYETAESPFEPHPSTSKSLPSMNGAKSKRKKQIQGNEQRPIKAPTEYLQWSNPNLKGDENICFVESFTLDINSKPCDQFVLNSTKLECPSDYMRFLGNV